MKKTALGHGLLIVGIIIIDRLTKVLALLLCHNICPVFPGLFFNVSFNTGVSFSLFQPHSMLSRHTLLFLISGVAILLIMRLYKRIKQNLFAWGTCLVVAGALGNLIDRCIYGGVIDFIGLYYKSWHFPLFNCADSAIVLGVLLMLLYEN